MSKRALMSFSKKSYIYLDNVEINTFLAIIFAMEKLDRLPEYSMTRLVMKTHDMNLTISKPRIRRMISFMLGCNPPYIKVRQKGRYRLVSPTLSSKKRFFGKYNQVLY